MKTARIVRWLLFGLGLPSIAFALWVAYRDVQGLTLPAAPRWAVALVACLVFLELSERSWSLFLPAGSTVSTRRTFYDSQLAKYNPFGGIAQAAAQTVLSTNGDSSRSQALGAMIWSKATAAGGGIVWALVYAVTGSGLATHWRLLLVVAGLSPLLLHPFFVATVLRPFLERFDRLADLQLPAASTILQSVGLSFAAVGTLGIGFGLLASGDETGFNGLLTTVCVFALAWTAAFVVVPLPGGIGLREAALGGALSLNPGVVLVAALGIRLSQIVSEVVLLAYYRLLRSTADLATPSSPSPERPPDSLPPINDCFPETP